MQLSPKQRSNQHKVLYVPYQSIANLFKLQEQTVRYKRVLPTGTIPDTAQIVSVHVDWNRASFALIIFDESFELIPEGIMIPELHVDWKTIEITSES